MDSIEATLNRYQPQILAIFQIMFGLLILQHACAKWFGFPVPGPAGVSVTSLVGWAGIIELVFGSLVTVGLFTRLSAFILSGEMAFAYFMGHFPRGWTPMGNAGSLATAYCFAFLLLVFFGGGAWSLDAMLRKKT